MRYTDFNWRPDAGPDMSGVLALFANNTWLPLGPSLVSQPINWAGGIWSGTCCCLLLVSGSSWIAGRTVALYAILPGAADYCVAWHYGWQGALIATLMNAIA